MLNKHSIIRQLDFVVGLVHEGNPAHQPLPLCCFNASGSVSEYILTEAEKVKHPAPRAAQRTTLMLGQHPAKCQNVL